MCKHTYTIDTQHNTKLLNLRKPIPGSVDSQSRSIIQDWRHCSNSFTSLGISIQHVNTHLHTHTHTYTHTLTDTPSKLVSLINEVKFFVIIELIPSSTSALCETLEYSKSAKLYPSSLNTFSVLFKAVAIAHTASYVMVS